MRHVAWSRARVWVHIFGQDLRFEGTGKGYLRRAEYEDGPEYFGLLSDDQAA